MDRFFFILFNDIINELGASLIKKIVITYLLFFLPAMILAVNSLVKVPPKEEIKYSYFKYWNPYRRILEIKGEETSFFGSTYFKVSYNKDGRIKTVTRIDQDKNAIHI